MLLRRCQLQFGRNGIAQISFTSSGPLKCTCSKVGQGVAAAFDREMC